jgi:hypothetical protein
MQRTSTTSTSTSIRQTLIRKADPAVYKKIKNGNLLRQPSYWTAYEILYLYGPLTGRELNQKAIDIGSDLTAFHTCLAKLRTANVLEVLGKVTCTITGVTAQLWDVTGNLPKQRVRHKVNKKRKKVKGQRPDIEDIVRAADEFKKLWKTVLSRGTRPVRAVDKTIDWLILGAPADSKKVLQHLKNEGAPKSAVSELLSWLKAR